MESAPPFVKDLHCWLQMYANRLIIEEDHVVFKMRELLKKQRDVLMITHFSFGVSLKGKLFFNIIVVDVKGKTHAAQLPLN